MLTIARTLIILHCVFVFFFPPEVARAFVAARNCDTATCHHLKKKKKKTHSLAFYAFSSLTHKQSIWARKCTLTTQCKGSQVSSCLTSWVAATQLPQSTTASNISQVQSSVVLPGSKQLCAKPAQVLPHHAPKTSLLLAKTLQRQFQQAY